MPRLTSVNHKNCQFFLILKIEKQINPFHFHNFFANLEFFAFLICCTYRINFCYVIKRLVSGFPEILWKKESGWLQTKGEWMSIKTLNYNSTKRGLNGPRDWFLSRRFALDSPRDQNCVKSSMKNFSYLQDKTWLEETFSSFTINFLAGLQQADPQRN